MMEELRASGVDTGGPPSFSQADRKAFANQLDTLLARLVQDGADGRDQAQPHQSHPQIAVTQPESDQHQRHARDDDDQHGICAGMHGRLLHAKTRRDARANGTVASDQ
ncbi:hypothetical protein G6F65_021556 [Rhizopus arrhizus]|nr:hypothetical protein G6F65_021556 [Rhizopus arrhizus]